MMAEEWIPKDIKGNDVDLSIYKGKVLLVINVASKCGLTNSNYDELNQLYQNYKDQGSSTHADLIYNKHDTNNGGKKPAPV
ncbi:probable phospholipid hydroperoxide glutathione peroxidase isoform X2 [Malus domestica]|uniref:probable phospholipid hydroperoxide glutathione peroxidase isoform X2 n=1 Tax=Malus domestica TaxID=3750 RepID=UPI003976F6C4